MIVGGAFAVAYKLAKMSAQFIGCIFGGFFKRALRWSNEGHQPFAHGEATAMILEEALDLRKSKLKLKGHFFRCILGKKVRETLKWSNEGQQPYELDRTTYMVVEGALQLHESQQKWMLSSLAACLVEYSEGHSNGQTKVTSLWSMVRQQP